MQEGSDFAQIVKAIQINDIHSVRQLVGSGQSQSTLNSSLCWASRLGNLPLCIFLVESGADVNAEVWGGFTPVIWASIFMGDVPVLEYLISQGANINHYSTKRRQTSLHAAIIKGNYQLAELLILQGAKLDSQDYLYKTPLLHAVQRNMSNCCKLLIHHNCNVNIPGFVNGQRLSPLLVALLQNNLEITKMLILAGAKFERMAIYQTLSIKQYYKTVEDSLNFELRPVYLKQQCRVCIRELLKPDFLQKLKQIDLPNSLRDFICMDELDGITT